MTTFINGERTRSSNKIFKPRQSSGWMWVGAIALVLLASGLYMLITYGFSGPFMLTILLTIPLGLVFLLITVFFPTMRYELGENRLILTYGPLLRYTIDLEQIKSIRRRDLKISPLSSFRFPGLAIFGVPYLEIGTVKMCATAAGKDILLIETASTKYGLTPANEEEFVAELRARMKK
ncbi:MAG TPA: PH domain-containing protein [Anaerolineales bacterium]|nr:PH domain-containing protein [Anaerolineales bacterium]